MQSALLLLVGCLVSVEPDDESPRTPPDEPTTTTTTTTETPPESPPGDRGISAGTFTDVQSRRDAFDLVDPPEPWNPNLSAAAPGTSPREPEMDDLQPSRVTPLRLSVSDLTPTPGRVPWNGYLGRLAAQDYVQSAYNSNWPFPEGREICVTPDILADCCSYTLTEGEDGSGVTTDRMSGRSSPGDSLK